MCCSGSQETCSCSCLWVTLGKLLQLHPSLYLMIPAASAHVQLVGKTVLLGFHLLLLTTVEHQFGLNFFHAGEGRRRLRGDAATSKSAYCFWVLPLGWYLTTPHDAWGGVLSEASENPDLFKCLPISRQNH